MRIVSLALAGALGLCAAAQAQTPKLEKPRIALSVGGSISQMNKVAYVVALHRKYFEQEGLTVDSTARPSCSKYFRFNATKYATLFIWLIEPPTDNAICVFSGF